MFIHTYPGVYLPGMSLFLEAGRVDAFGNRGPRLWNINVLSTGHHNYFLRVSYSESPGGPFVPNQPTYQYVYLDFYWYTDLEDGPTGPGIYRIPGVHIDVRISCSDGYGAAPLTYDTTSGGYGYVRLHSI
jgi:hypothetical protein